MNVRIYTRVSPKGKGKSLDDSIEIQNETCTRYARQVLQFRGLLPLYSDVGISGGIPLKERNAGFNLISAIYDSDHVVMQRLDRGWRDVPDCLQVVEYWQTKRNVTLHLADQGGCSINAGTATGRFMLTCLAGIAAFERGITSERTSSAMKKYQRDGRYMGGKPPYGFRVIKGKLLQDAREQSIIDSIRCGHNRRQSNRYLADRFNLHHLTVAKIREVT